MIRMKRAGEWRTGNEYTRRDAYCWVRFSKSKKTQAARRVETQGSERYGGLGIIQYHTFIPFSCFNQKKKKIPVAKKWTSLSLHTHTETESPTKLYFSGRSPQQ